MARGKPVFGGRTTRLSNFRKCLKADVVELALNHGFEMKVTKFNHGDWNEFREFKFHKGDKTLHVANHVYFKSDRPDWRQLWNDLSQELQTGEFWGE